MYRNYKFIIKHRMKHTFCILILFISLSIPAFAQLESERLNCVDTIVGKNFITGTHISANKYHTLGKISKWHWDGVSDNLLLEIKPTDNKKKGFSKHTLLKMIDIKQEKVKWSRSVENSNSEINVLGEYLFFSEKNKNTRINPDTGENMWTDNTDFIFVAPHMNIGIGFPVQSYSNKLSAIDLSTGKRLWRKKINRNNEQTEPYLLNDSIIVIPSDGIQALNLMNGAGWIYKAKTRKSHYGKMIGVNSLGIILGVLTGVTVYQAQPDVTSDLASNILIDSNENIIHASRKLISKIDQSGETIWSRALPEKVSSKSSLFVIDSVVYLINRGFALYNNNFSAVGKPYIASFDTFNGKQHYLTLVEEKGKFIRSYQAVDNKLFLLFDNQVSAYDLIKGVKISENLLSLPEDEKLEYFTEADSFWRKEGLSYKNMASDLSPYNLIFTSKGRLIVMTDNLETVITFDKEAVYEEKISNEYYKLITNNDSDYIVLNHLDQTLTELNLSNEMFLKNNNLYFFDKGSLHEVNFNKTEKDDTLWESILKSLYKHIQF